MGGQDGAQNSGDSEDVFEDEEMSSSECNSEESGYSRGDPADLISQEGSKAELKINQLQGNATPVKAAERSGSQEKGEPAAMNKVRAGTGAPGGFGDSDEDSEFFDQEEQ